MFNLRKFAQSRAAADTSKPISKQLGDLRKEYGQQPPDEGNTELQLEANSHKNVDNSVPFNVQLEAARTGTLTAVTEHQLNKVPTLFNEKRDDRTHNKGVTAPNLVAEAYHQEKLKAFNKAQEGQTRDTSFWDDMVGVQLEGGNPITKIVSNDQYSQLQNQEDRFKGLKPDLSTSKDFNEFVEASFKQADQMIFHIFASAAAESRKITAKEKQQITDINSGKARILASFEQKNAQLMDGASPFADAGNPAQPAPTDPNGVEDLTQDVPDQSVQEGHYTIEPSQQGYALMKIPANGEKEQVEVFPTSQEAHDYASKAPELDGFSFSEENSSAPQSAGDPKDFSPIQGQQPPVTQPQGF
jgi:hypothetical protein